MLRSAASPGSVGFGRFGSGTSGLLMTPLPTGHLRSRGRDRLPKRQTPEKTTNAKGARRAPLSLVARARALLDLCLAELDVLLGDRIVFLLGQLVGHGARVLARDIVEAGVGARHELDLDGDSFRHNVNLDLRQLGRNVAAPAAMSRKRVGEGTPRFVRLIPIRKTLDSSCPRLSRASTS